MSTTTTFGLASPDRKSATLPRPSNPVRLRGIALPNEHGSWGILFEPLVAATAVAFSGVSLFIALLFVSSFLMRQPLRVWLADVGAGRNLPQTAAARKYSLIFFLMAAVGLAGSLVFAPIFSLVPLLFIMPLAAVQIRYDVARQSRRLLPELCGAVALSSSAAVIALAGGWSYASAAALSVIFVLRMVPSILYVRNRLLLEKGKSHSIAVPVGTHILAFAVVTILSYFGLCPVVTAVVFAVLLGRAWVGLSSYRRKRKAMQLGILEVVFGVLTVLSVVVGHYFNL
ncbi:MAG TPA: YwiC-like family protein [Pyrinomonadaceae bacterium]|nr:YwiC-like family protein [Pyrinomonadaceae bacterium]